jgi:hypothetical protein
LNLSLKLALPLAAILFLGGLATGRLLLRPKVITKTEVVEKIKVVTLEVEKKVVKTRKTKTTKKPDGTVVTEETVRDAQTDTAITKDKTADTKTATTQIPLRNDWMVSVLGGTEAKLPLQPVFGGHVQRRILGPIYVGAWGLSNGSLGLSLGGSF